jgi:hypothetical protein
MSYTLNHTNGTFLTTVSDGSIDNTTDLTFVGKNYSGYGTIINQDLVKLLENFAGSVQPTKSLLGQIWYDSGNRKVKFYTGSRYKAQANIESGNNYPTDMTDGDLFWNISEQRLYIYDATYATWRIVGPQFTPAQQVNSVIYSNVLDDQGFSHNILKYQMEDLNNNSVVTAISNPDPDFTLGASYPIPGFTTINQGITLKGTDASGISTDFTLWGTASNSTKVGGKLVSELVLVASPSVTGQIISTNDLGLLINSATVLKNNSGNTQLANLTDSGQIIFTQIKGVSLFNIASFGFKGDSGRAALLPTDSNTEVTDIGSSGRPFAHGSITIMTSNTTTVKTTLNAQTISAYTPNGEATTIGSALNPFDNVYAYNMHAIDGISGPLLANTSAPTSVSSTGTQGQVAFDSTHIYVCVANNTWRRASLTTW